MTTLKQRVSDLLVRAEKAERELATTRKAHAVTAEKQMVTATALMDAERERDEAHQLLAGRCTCGAPSSLQKLDEAEATIARVAPLPEQWREAGAGVTIGVDYCADELEAALTEEER